MIVYGSSTGDSIAALFSGGIMLGLIIVIGEILVCYFISKKLGYGGKTQYAASFGSTKGVAWALVFPVLIFVSIITGFMTATETAALAVVYAWFVGACVYQELKMGNFPSIVIKAMKSSGAIMAIVGSATTVAWVLTYNRVPQQVTEAMVNGINSPMVFMVISFLILFVIGMIMDLTPAILILTPIFIEPIKAFSIDPVYFGVFFCSVLTAGLITPPVGTLIYMGCSQSKASFGTMVRSLLPFILVVYVVLFFATVFPGLITFLPKHILHIY
jgi:C4-dicarboxylate transporter DctM subunit